MIVLTVNISDLKDGDLNLEIKPSLFWLHFFLAHVPSFTRCCCYLEFPADENFREKNSAKTIAATINCAKKNSWNCGFDHATVTFAL